VTKEENNIDQRLSSSCW